VVTPDISDNFMKKNNKDLQENVRKSIGFLCFIGALFSFILSFIFGLNIVLLLLFFALLIAAKLLLPNFKGGKPLYSKSLLHPFNINNQSQHRSITDPVNPGSPNNPANHHYLKD